MRSQAEEILTGGVPNPAHFQPGASPSWGSESDAFPARGAPNPRRLRAEAYPGRLTT